MIDRGHLTMIAAYAPEEGRENNMKKFLFYLQKEVK